MLVVKRKEHESILIGDDIEIIISEITQDKVKLCINAPKEVRISRKELVETGEFNKIASANINIDAINMLKEKFKEKK